MTQSTTPPRHWADQRVHLNTVVPGPKSHALRAREDAHIAPGLQGYATMSGVAVERGAGSAVTDVDGNVLLDFIGGIGVNAFGHNHPAIRRAVSEQVDKISVSSFTTEPRAKLVERLAAHAPAGVHRVQLYSGGAEAVESALRLVKSHTKKSEVVAFWGGFHGKTMGALSLMGSTFKEGLGPMVPGSHFAPYADCYRCPLGATYPSCGLGCVELARKKLRLESTGSIAAILVEPMQGTSGNVIPPDDFLPAVAAMAKENDALLIVDEMLTGFGRTGKYWGLGHSGIAPDVMTIGKAFGGGLPLTGVMTTDAIAAARPWSLPSGSSSSYGGNPLSAAAGLAALEALDAEGLVESSRVVGAEMLAALAPFEGDYPFVGLVGGRGLFLRMELVANKVTREPLSKGATMRIFHECIRRGLLTMAYSPHFRIQPALTIDAATARNGIAILREVFDLAKRERWADA